MATLASIEKQIETLKKKAESIRKTEMSAAIKTVRDLISQFGLTAQDVGLIGGRGKSKAVSAPKAAGAAKYRDPNTGKTWTGHGKPPGWIAGAADRTKFLIDGPATSAPAAVAPAPKVVKAVKAPKAAKVTKAAEVKATGLATKVSAKKAAAVKAAPSAEKAPGVKKAPAVKKAARAAEAVTTQAAPAKKGSAAPKANKSAAKKAVPAKAQDRTTDAAAPTEAA